VYVYNPGGGPVGAWTVSPSTDDGEDWLSVSPGSGSGATSISISINAALLSAGAHNGTITVTTDAGESAVTRVFIQQCQVMTLLTPSSFFFPPGVTASSGLFTSSSTVIGCNPGLFFPDTISASTLDGGKWLSASLGLPAVSVNPKGLAPGAYNGAVKRSFANGSAATAPVTMLVGQPGFTLSPSTLQFAGRPTLPAPQAQLVSMSLPAAASWTASPTTSDNRNWLSVFPASGTGPGTLAVSVNKEGLNPGISYGTVSVNAGAAGTAKATVTLQILGNDSTVVYTDSYYFPHLVTGGGWQTTLTFVNYSPYGALCQANFHSDQGAVLKLSFYADFSPFSPPYITTVLAPGEVVHKETKTDPNAPLVEGWADMQCTGPVKASLLFRLYRDGVAVSEASVDPTTPASDFAAFAQINERGATGFALANPSAQSPAAVTLTAYDGAGQVLASANLSLAAWNHSAVTADQLFSGLSNFIGSVRMSSSVPILALALNFEANPVFSSLPSAGLNIRYFAPLTSYFPHLVIGGGWQTTLTFVNSSQIDAHCQTSFTSDSGTPLTLSFKDQSGTGRTDIIPPNGSVHQETVSALGSPIIEGWAATTCDAPVKASLLFRFYNEQGPVSEAAVNALAAASPKFATFAQVDSRGSTGIAYANPNDQPATLTVFGLGIDGLPLSLGTVVLPPHSHRAITVDKLIDNSGFNYSGSVQIASDVPIIAMSLNFEAAPVFSSLPAGDLPASVPMSTATGP
jgi:hypothetical protein